MISNVRGKKILNPNPSSTSEIANSIISVDFLTLGGELKTLKRDQINFYYRGSDFGESVIILNVKLKANRGNKDEIQKKQNKFD